MKTRKIVRKFHHYTLCEEFDAGMWRIVPSEEKPGFIRTVAEFMKDAEAFHAGMMRAVREWPYSCEAAFTASSVNQRAWVGHAACCIVHHSPEDLTRLAWHTLTKEQQDAGNAAADRAIAAWRASYTQEAA
jgi:hypothetical protein